MLSACIALTGVIALQQILYYKERSRLIDRIMSKDYREFKTATDSKPTPQAIKPYEEAIKKLSNN